jgi:hypothetical protein
MSAVPRLTPAQDHAVRTWFPSFEPIADLSWGLTDTVVLRLRHAGRDAIIKAGGPGNHHIGREITAHERWTAPWRTTGRAARLLHADRERNVLAISYLPGTLVAGHPAAGDAEVHRQAGELLAAFHAQECRVSGGYESRADARALAWLDQDHRIDPATETRLRERVTARVLTSWAHPRRRPAGLAARTA